jgi:hypothetical protein
LERIFWDHPRSHHGFINPHINQQLRILHLQRTLKKHQPLSDLLMLSYLALGVNWMIHHNERIVTALALYQRNDLWSVLSDNPPMWERSGSLKDEDSLFHAFFTAAPGFEDHLRCESVPMKTNALIEEPFLVRFRVDCRQWETIPTTGDPSGAS